MSTRVRLKGSAPATGSRVPCRTSSQVDGKDDQSAALEISIVLAQDASDPGAGTATVSGTGNALLDDRPIAATFARQRFEANEMVDNLPSKCPMQHSLHIAYDFDGFGERSLQLEDSATPDCENAPADYCKGQLNLMLELIE